MNLYKFNSDFFPLKDLSTFEFTLCQNPIFFLLKSFQGNFSPGSFFLKGAMSEWPKILFLWILYFLIINFEILIKHFVWLSVKSLYPCSWPGLEISIPIDV